MTGQRYRFWPFVVTVAVAWAVITPIIYALMSRVLDGRWPAINVGREALSALISGLVFGVIFWLISRRPQP